jgi:uncharacterized membrane protein
MGISVLLLCAVVFLLAAGAQKIWPPKGINSLYGYRTRTSMASQERWDFAQQQGILEMARGGVMMLILSWPVYHYTHGIGEDQTTQVLIELAILIAVAVSIFIRTERAIKERFGPLP